VIPETLSHYRVLEKLGAGGMGVVYVAEDLRLGRRVALKFLPDDVAGNPAALERLKREARAASSLEHPNICTIHDIDEADGHSFIVMELIEGETLRDTLSRAPASLEKILEIAIQIADALDAAHARGILHRDIKPGNILVTKRGQAKLMDFGLAKRFGEPARGSVDEVSALQTAVAPEPLTDSGATLGTVAYMSPEQARGEPLDARSDIFSFGAVLYEMATGRQAFGGSTTAVVFDAILNRAPVAPVRINPALPAELERIVNKALEKDRDLRYQSAAEMLAELKRLRRDSSSPRPALTTELPVAPLARPKMAVFVAVAIIAAGVAAGVFYLQRRRAATGATGSVSSLAVLPFKNLGAPGGEDYLGIAIPDEITTALSYVPRLALRPFSQTSRYAGPSVDPQQAGRELRVAQILTGHYVTSGDRLEVTMEAIDVDENRLLWRDSVSAPPGDLIALRGQIESRLKNGLVPKLAGAGGSASSVPASRPRNQEAYDLYLRSLAVGHDLEPNRTAITMLERSVALDPEFATAWYALGRRYYDESLYAGGGRLFYEKARGGYERAMTLDPEDVQSPANLAIMRTEQGDLEGAYDDAKNLVRRRPDNPHAHHTLGYMYRYAGLLEESARECDEAMRLDPTNREWRSCSMPFLVLGRYDRARQFLALDAGSAWARRIELAILTAEGKTDEIRKLLTQDPGVMATNQWILLRAYLEKRPETEIEAAAARAERDMPDMDGEPCFFIGQTLAYCERKERALRLLRESLDRGFIPYPAMDIFPAYAKYSSEPSFLQTRALAIERQKKFLAYRAGHP
jgi:eukaryotic-like serine/threonine-protein kinase